MSIESLTAQLRDFARDREWEQFHTPKNLAMSVKASLVSGALMLN